MNEETIVNEQNENTQVGQEVTAKAPKKKVSAGAVGAVVGGAALLSSGAIYAATQFFPEEAELGEEADAKVAAANAEQHPETEATDAPETTEQGLEGEAVAEEGPADIEEAGSYEDVPEEAGLNAMDEGRMNAVKNEFAALNASNEEENLAVVDVDNAPGTAGNTFSDEEAYDAISHAHGVADNVRNAAEAAVVEEETPLASSDDALKAEFRGLVADIKADADVILETQGTPIEIEPEPEPEPEYMEVAESVDDDMSFSEAFAAARSEVGPGGLFVWRGNTYGTYYKNEWDSMTGEDRDEYWASVERTTNHLNGIDDPTENIAEEVTGDDDVIAEVEELAETETVGVDDDEVVAEGEEPDQVDYSAAKVATIDLDNDGQDDFAVIDLDADGSADAIVADLDGNGMAEIILDTDGDGVMDAMIVDADIDENGELVFNDIVDLSETEDLADSNDFVDDVDTDLSDLDM